LGLNNTHELSRGLVAAIGGMIFLAISATHAAQAASGDAWEEFQQEVDLACREAAKGVIAPEVVQVDPYGSESYGFAVLVGPEVGSSALKLVACAYDKASQKAEVSGAFTF
jgi:hypothetical protein